MRVLFAAIFVFGSTLGTVGLLGSHFEGQSYPWWATALPIVAMFAAMILSLFVFNSSGYRPNFRRKSLDEYIAELRTQNKLLSQQFKAVRAFAVEEFEDEGSHYYLELVDGRVLYLNGQYLYDYEPIRDNPELNRERSFPCTEFEVLRHKDAGYVIHIRCSGAVIDPEVTAPPFTPEASRLGLPEDGEIIEGKSYELIRTERVAG